MSAPQAWYREPWPWILMSGPVTVIIAGVATTWIAFASADGLVADDYYKKGLGINKRLAREESAARLGLQADVTRSAGEVAVRLQGAAPEAVFLHLAHATRAGHDVRLRLARGADGRYAAPLAPLAPGHWRVVLEDPRGEWRLVQDGLREAS
jgi:hypothetical protein